MKILRWATAVLFGITLCLYGLFLWQENSTRDDSYPILQIPEGILEISVNAAEEELLEGVTAFDEKDGDLSDRILIESVSKFLERGVCTITYAVSDSDCHVVKASRSIHYTDYIPPKFYLKMPMAFSVDSKINIREQIGAVDCLDGDISDRVTILGTNYSNNHPGIYTISVQVTSSRGDKAYLDLPVHIDEIGKYQLDIQLSKPIIYVKTGSEPDFEEFVRDVSNQHKPVSDYQIKMSTNFNSDQPGSYSVHYYAYDKNDNQGHTVLTVIVEE